MEAIAVTPGKAGAYLTERPEPAVAAPNEVKVRIIRVGICGTDREEAAGGRALAPGRGSDLVIGHEMLGQVVETGRAVTRVKPDDYAIFTVRRGCETCLPCRMLRPDMCRTGGYQERGIWGLDGYQTEFVVDTEAWVVRVPEPLAGIGVLVEPLSVVEKAIDESVRVQFARLPDAAATPDWLFGRRCLVAGLGPIGLLACTVLRLRGAQVFGLDVVDSASARPRWLEAIGGQYIDGRSVFPDRIEAAAGAMDMILEATGVAKLAFDLLEALAPEGVYVMTGIPGGDRPVELPAAELMRRLVLRNQVMIGSVNAARDYFQMAVDDLAAAECTWSGHVAQLITHRHPYKDFAAAFGSHSPDEIKAVVEWQ